MPKLRIKRKAFSIRRAGKKIKVKATSFFVRDRGKPGRTPRRKRWFKPSIETGWSKELPMNVRRAKTLKAHKGDRLATARSLNALANVTTDKRTEQLARADARYFFGEYAKTKK